jgi:spore coat protein CotF
MAKTRTQERKLNSYVLRTFIPSLQIRNNRVINTAANLKKVNKASGLKRFVKEVVNFALFEYYEKQFEGVNKHSNRYYGQFEPTEAAQKRIINRGQTITNGFIDELFDNNDIVKGLQQTIRNNIITETRTTELSALLTDQIKGKAEKLGAVTSYHYKNGFDEFQGYSRSLDEQFSKELNLTILSWNHTPETWVGRKENNNILIDMGGWNCRHDFDWVSWPLARRVDPNMERSKFDKI